MTRNPLAIAPLAALLLLGAAGCVYPAPYAAGPPPHAPAYGYRHPHARDDVDLVWNAPLGVYAVVGFPSVYFWNDRYYRYHDAGWQRGAGPRGRWEPYRGHLPPGLAKQHHGPQKNYHRGKGGYR